MYGLLAKMQIEGGSDLFITAGAPPCMRLHGKITPLTEKKMTPQQTMALSMSVMEENEQVEFKSTRECNFAISVPDVARFRVNAFVQRGSAGMVIRIIGFEVPSFSKLNLPPVLKEVAMTTRGLVIFVGGTGSGKSTSLAALIDYRNENSQGHIITIEDPVEFVHKHKGCLVTQREVGTDTADFSIALKNTLRQAPDVILIGEIRDQHTMEHAISFAETGHLCLATLHANNSNQAMDRIINFFPEERHKQLMLDLSLNLKGVISQRLLSTPEGDGRRAAVEILLNTPLMSELIKKGEVHEMKELVKKSTEQGMKTFDQAIFELIKSGEVTLEEGMRNADSVNDLRLKIKLDEAGQGMAQEDEGAAGLELKDADDDSYKIAS
ncbi:type IV pili twitching motility protein PilT [Chromatiales bacterium (ex Bugula neritina AB1)]|nr:type IV pili twitching motility protein PilT [Chromatiales bacterium (ex Bugula neritina AB1)]